MPISRKIETFTASISVTTGLGRIDLTLADKSRKTLDRLQPETFCAAMVILQGSSLAYFAVDPASRQEVIATSVEPTGQ